MSSGGAGADIIEAGEGSDTVIGGSGEDQLIWSNDIELSLLSVAFDGGSMLLQEGDFVTTVTGVESITVDSKEFLVSDIRAAWHSRENSQAPVSLADLQQDDGLITVTQSAAASSALL